MPKLNQTDYDSEVIVEQPLELEYRYPFDVSLAKLSRDSTPDSWDGRKEKHHNKIKKQRPGMFIRLE